MTISTTSKRSLKKAFTLLELIVVIVILGILAALAVPTFARVVKRSQDSSTAATTAAVLRDARALMSFGDAGYEWSQAVADAATETSYSAAGLSAAGMTATSVTGLSAERDPGAAEVLFKTTLATSSAPSSLSVALKSRSGDVCMGAVSLAATTSVTCVPGRTMTDSPDGETESDEVFSFNKLEVASQPLFVGLPTTPPTTPPAPVVSAPSAPSSLSVTPGVSSLSLSWGASTANGSPVTGYQVVLSGSDGSSVTKSATSTSLVVTGLKSSVTYTASVRATSSAGASSASTASGTPLAEESGFTTFTRVVTSPVAVGDTFNRGVATTSLGKVTSSSDDQLQTWQEVAGTWSVTAAGAAYRTGSTVSTGISLVDLGTSEQQVTIHRPNPDYTGSPGVVLRYQDSKNYVAAYTRSTTAHVFQVKDGVVTNLGSVASAGPVSDYFHVEVSGSTLKFWSSSSTAFSTTPRLTVTLPGDAPAGTGIGLYTEYGTSDRRVNYFTAAPIGWALPNS
jgi:prepilin-type N-terminal cleavage/methylation domain-containing protein